MASEDEFAKKKETKIDVDKLSQDIKKTAAAASDHMKDALDKAKPEIEKGTKILGKGIKKLGEKMQQVGEKMSEEKNAE